MNSGDKRFEELNTAIGEVRGIVTESREELTEIKTKVALYGAMGGVAGSVVVGLIVAIGTSGVG